MSSRNTLKMATLMLAGVSAGLHQGPWLDDHRVSNGPPKFTTSKGRRAKNKRRTKRARR